MNIHDDTDDFETKHICFQCVGEAYLSEEIKQNGEVTKCAYCDHIAEAYTIEEFSDRIETAFNDHFFRTSDQPDSWQQSLLADRESHYNWYRDGIPVSEAIESVADISSEAAADVQAILDDRYGDFEMDQMGEETEFGSSSYYEERGQSDTKWQEEWRVFERSLQKEARFFSRIAASHLTRL